MKSLILALIAFSAMNMFTAVVYGSEMSSTMDSDSVISELTRRLSYKQQLADALLDKVNNLQTSNGQLNAELREKTEEIARLRAELQRCLKARNESARAMARTTVSPVREVRQLQAPTEPVQPQGRWIVSSRQNLVRAGYWVRVYSPETYIPVYDYYRRRVGTRVCRSWHDEYVQPVYENVYYRQWQPY